MTFLERIENANTAIGHAFFLFFFSRKWTEKNNFFHGNRNVPAASCHVNLELITDSVLRS